jgi:hypothetical protein
MVPTHPPEVGVEEAEVEVEVLVVVVDVFVVELEDDEAAPGRH